VLLLYFALTATLKKASFKNNQLEALCVFLQFHYFLLFFVWSYYNFFYLTTNEILLCIHLLTVLSIDTVFPRKNIQHFSLFRIPMVNLWFFKNFTFIFKIMWKKRNIVAFGPMVKETARLVKVWSSTMSLLLCYFW
jgi:hypothetical protein